MNSSPPAAQSPPRRPGLLARLVMTPLYLFGLLCGALLLALTLQALGMLLLWPQQGWLYADTLAQQELTHIQVAFPRSLLMTDPARNAQRLDDTLQDWLLQRSGLIHKHPTDLDTQSSFRQHLIQAKNWLNNAMLAAAHTLRFFALRLLALTLSLPLFLTTATLGLVDGLVRRDQRRFGAGQESGFIYHRAKASLGPLIVWPWLLWLSLPISLPTLAIMLPAAVLQGVALSLTASRFKKSL